MVVVGPILLSRDQTITLLREIHRTKHKFLFLKLMKNL
jgi:hypothetical protein